MYRGGRLAVKGIQLYIGSVMYERRRVVLYEITLVQ